MKQLFKAGRVPAVAGLLLSFCLGMFVTATMAPRGMLKPEVEFYCDTFDLLPDGSVQAWVDIRVKNIEYFTGLGFNLDYNKAEAAISYFRPSRVDDNEEIDVKNERFELTRDFFRVHPDLYGGADPFDEGMTESAIWKEGYQDTLSFSTLLKNANIISAEGKVLGPVYDEDDRPYLYIDTMEQPDGVTVGSLSFRVDAEQMPDLIKTYEDSGRQGSVLMETIPLGEDIWNSVPAWEVKFLEIFTENGTSWVEDKNGTYVHKPETESQSVDLKYTFEFPDTLIRAALMEDYVRVNAWEAYANGDWSDVAALLQRYSGQIELGYANGDVEREVFPWGAANDPDSADPQPDYTIYRLNTIPGDYREVTLDALVDTDWVAVDTATETYSSEAGVYKVEQYYCYTEEGIAKRYPVPEAAYVVIDPVKLTGAWADKLYLARERFGTVADLELPGDALLQTEPNLPGISLSLMIDAGWGDQGDPGQLTIPPVGTPGTYYYSPKFVSDLDLSHEAERVYPWLTLGSALLTAEREIIVSDLTPYQYEGKVDREVNSSDLADVDGKFTIQKFKLTQGEGGATQAQVSMGKEQHSVQLYLPNGVEISQDWFSSGYKISQDGDDYVILLDTSSDNVATGYESQVGSLRAYLNLGGWFGVVVTDKTENVTGIRSDRINVYLTPRENIYMQSESYDFTGHRAGLLPLYASSISADGTATVEPLSTTVTLPMGYFVSTLYDGATGEPGGKLGVVKIEDQGEDGWTVTPSPMEVPKGTSGIFTHGPDGSDMFKSVAAFDGYGSVYNDDGYTATILAQYDNPETGGQTKPKEVLNVYYNGSTNPNAGPDVNVVYDAKQQGYIYRQEVTLVLKNEGTTDVSGIYIDPDYSPFQDKPDPLRGHFEVLRAPATYLPAGGETTFVLTYIYDLTYNTFLNPNASGTTYLDTLSVGTNNDTAATTFTAQFRVTELPVSKVTVVTIPSPDPTKPGGNTMGEAEVMVGFAEGRPGDIASSSPVEAPNTASGSTTYEEGYQYVWIRATPSSEYEVNYEVESVYYYSGGEKVILSNENDGNPDLGPYLYTNPANGREKYYYFKMPNHDTTVYVKFYEPTRSKLRLSELLVYAAEGTDPQGPGVGTWGEPESSMLGGDRDTYLQVLRRDDGGATNEPLTYPAAFLSPAKYTLTETESSYDKFFSVLPSEAGFAQISFSLRETLEMLGLDDQKMNSALPEEGWQLTVGARSKLLDGAGYEELVLDYDATPNPPYQVGQPGWTGPRPEDPLPRTSEHFTYVFEMPEQGGERTVAIWLRYQKDDGTDVVERSIEVRLLRESEIPPNQLNYGNSPYGMIMADISVARKDIAKESFSAATEDSAAYAFDPNLFVSDADVNLIPKLVRDKKMYQTYWPEIWSGTSNYDEHETVLFAVIGKMVQDPGFMHNNVKDGAGNPVDYKDISVKVTADFLASGGTTQVDRFEGNGASVETNLPIGTLAEVYAGVTWEVFSQGQELRPGIYENGLEYSYTDYDGTIAKLYRPLVIVAQPGDVNADGRMNTDSTGALDREDERLVENRVTDPLGYTVDVTAWPHGELHRLRSCDTNNDCIMNNIDANAIKAEALIPYYLSEYKVNTTDF